MQPYDIIMLIVLAIATFMGFRKGIVWQVASILAIFASYFVAVRYRDIVASRINAEPPWNTALAMLVVYVGTSLAIWILFRFVRGFIERTKLTGFDRQLGALLGLAKGCVLCIIITLFAVTLLGEKQRQDIIDSKSGFYIAQLLDRADAIMPAEMHDYLDPYLNEFGNQLGTPSSSHSMDAEMEQLQDWLHEKTELIKPGSSTAADLDRRLRVFDRR
ncbi:MAG: colicin V production protein [Planctomycetaceae bacterium]|nr:colicin V production protein [Planctomycetaceae bacterium]